MQSLGFRTDLALLERAGSTIEDCGDHLVVRSPSNPTFYWGNFLLLDHVPAADRVDGWLDRFDAALPGARHRSFGFDAPRRAWRIWRLRRPRAGRRRVDRDDGNVRPPTRASERRGGLPRPRVASDWLVAERRADARLQRRVRAGRPPHVRRAQGGEQPCPRRGRPRRVVRRVPRRGARVPDGPRHGRAGAGAVPVGRDPPRRARPRARRDARAPRRHVRLRHARRRDARDGRRPGVPRDQALPLGRVQRRRVAAPGRAQARGGSSRAS